MIANGVKITIYRIPGSHPSEAVFKAAELKGIDYKRVDLIPSTQPIVMTLLFGGRTVPAMKIVGGPNGTEKVQTSIKILRALESIQPEPPLYPARAGERERVLSAEAWGDGELQDVARRLGWMASTLDPDSMFTFAEGHNMPLPISVLKPFAKSAVWIERRINGANEEQARKDLANLPGLLDEVNDYIAAGVIGGEQPNAADFMIFSSIWVLRAMRDLRPLIDATPAGRHSVEVFGETTGNVPTGTFPAAWLTEVNVALGRHQSESLSTR
jgi:glutathione S-transferase